MEDEEKRASPWTKIGRLFRSIDLFGHQVRFNVNGAEAFKTSGGAMLTLVILAALLYFAIP